MNDEIKLKTCPFCGNDAMLVKTLFGEWTVCCETIDCRCWDYGYGSCCYKTKKEAVAAWNRRAES